MAARMECACDADLECQHDSGSVEKADHVRSSSRCIPVSVVLSCVIAVAVVRMILLKDEPNGSGKAARQLSSEAAAIQSLSLSLDGHIRSIDSTWDGQDEGWNFSNEDVYYYTQPPGMFPQKLALYAVTVKSIDDIQKAIVFAANHNLTVSVKANGHSYMGAGIGGKLLIYMGSMSTVTVQRNRTYCDAAHDSMEVGGGTTFANAYRTIGDNFTTVGGQGPTVNMGGGWVLGNGMSNEVLPMYGLGVDNVLQHEIVLANGSHVTANACTNPELFKALRGGGGGFGVITSVHFKLHPSSQLQRYKWTEIYPGSSDVANPDVKKRWDLFLRWVGRWDKRWSTKYVSGAAIYTFLGPHEEAVLTPFYTDATSVFGSPVHDSYRSLLHFKLTDGASGNDYDNSINRSSMRQLGGSYVGNWLVPLRYLVENPNEARNMFMNASASGALCPYHGEYFLGGMNNDIEENNDQTSVHPATRRAVLQASICDEAFMHKMMGMFPDSCVGINHAPAHLQDWKNKLWGPKYKDLLAVKNAVDPYSLFQGQQLVGSEN